MSTFEQVGDDRAARGSARPTALARGSVLSLTLWPHRSLPRHQVLGVVAVALAGFSLPMAGLIGGDAFWVVAAFDAATLAMLCILLGLTYRTGRVCERLEIWPDRLRVERTEPNGRRQVWTANPHWVRVSLHDTPRISDYLVLSASGKEVELGAFLTPQERRELAEEIRRGLSDAARAASESR